MTNLKLHEDCKALSQAVYSNITFNKDSYINAIIKNNKNIIVINLGGLIYVEEYTRSDGTKVSGYYRRP